MTQKPGWSVPEGTLPIYQHWPGSWRPAEGTWRWAESVGFRAVAVESQDHFEGPPTRPALRQQFFRRNADLHGTGELVSWTRGRELQHLGVDGVLEQIEASFKAAVEGTTPPLEAVKQICDLFMAARCGDYLDQLLERVKRSPCVGWVGAVKRALAVELVIRKPQELLESHEFWRTGVMPELVSSLAPVIWGFGLKRGGFFRNTELQLGQTLLWGSGAAGQILREALQVDWTDAVLEQGVLKTIQNKDPLNHPGHSFLAWLVRPAVWRCRRANAGKTLPQALYVHAVNYLHRRSPELDALGWRVQPQHWARIIEWVLVWRRELHKPEMLKRAHALAALLLVDDSLHGPGDELFPVTQLNSYRTTPAAVGDRPLRLHWDVEWSHPHDFRLEDEIFPAITAVVVAWYRGAGQASCGKDAFDKAPWLQQLITARRLRMHLVQKGLATCALQLGEYFLQHGVNEAVLLEGVCTSVNKSEEQFKRWTASHALGDRFWVDFFLELVEARMFSSALQLNVVDRVAKFGTGQSAGINADILWGLSCVAERMRSLPFEISPPPAIELDDEEEITFD